MNNFYDTFASLWLLEILNPHFISMQKSKKLHNSKFLHLCSMERGKYIDPQQG